MCIINRIVFDLFVEKINRILRIILTDFSSKYIKFLVITNALERNFAIIIKYMKFIFSIVPS